jgi:hypothetical protein
MAGGGIGAAHTSYRFSRKLIRFDKAEVCATADNKLKINARRER